MEHRAPATLVVLAASLSLALSLDTQPPSHHTLSKRQIFREQVLPHTGGKIPSDAFRSDRLALNRLNKEGIAVPDGILLETRHRESHHTSHRNDPDIQGDIIKLIQKPDGRYAPPEGRYPFNNLIESTYVIRKPINTHHFVFPPQRPIQVPLRLPARPYFASEDDLYSFNHLDHSIDLLNGFNADFTSNRVWNPFGSLFHDNGNRILRQTIGSPFFQQGSVSSDAHQPAEQVVAASSHPPSLDHIPQTSFECPRVQSQMIPDQQTDCQVFHLCHADGNKESFLCPKGSRFDPSQSQCVPWTQVSCHGR